MALTLKQRKFVEAYLGPANGNATEAARQAGYTANGSSLRAIGSENLTKLDISEAISAALKARCMSADDILSRLAQQAQGAANYIGKTDELGQFNPTEVDLVSMKADGMLHLVKSLKYSDKGQLLIEFYDAQAALTTLGRYHKLWVDRRQDDVDEDALNSAIERGLARMAGKGETEVPGAYPAVSGE